MNRFVIIAFLAGSVLPIQAAINARLAVGLKSSVSASLVSFVVASIFLLLATLAVRPPRISGLSTEGIPLWAWFGGVLGACYVFGVIVSLEKIGATATFCLTIAGQAVVALIVDRFGLFGTDVVSISPVKLAGAAFVVFGAVLVTA